MNAETSCKRQAMLRFGCDRHEAVTVHTRDCDLAHRACVTQLTDRWPVTAYLARWVEFVVAEGATERSSLGLKPHSGGEKYSAR